MIEPKIVVDMKELKDLTEAFPTIARNAKKAKLTEAIELLYAAIVEETPRGAGPVHIADTIFRKVSTSGEQMSGLLGTPAVYGMPLELGSRPHFPPIDPIEHWVERKLGIVGKASRSVAFLIARKIARKGTDAAKMFERGFEKKAGSVIAILEQIPEDIVRRFKK